MKKRTRPHKLEYESEIALRNFLLSTGWIVRRIDPDYGEDLEVVIVEGEDVTNKTVRVQLKSTDKDFPVDKPIPYQMETDDLVFLEGCQVPALIILWVKPHDNLYCLFVQEYLREELSKTSPGWRGKKKPTIKFPLDSKLETPDVLSDIATAGYLYVIANKLEMDQQSKGAHYYLNGIPQSDNKTLKERTLKALTLMVQVKYALAIDEFEDILKTCTLSPTEQISILINQGNAYLRLSRNDNAFDNFNKVLKLVVKVSQKDALEGKSIALGSIGLIYYDWGELDEALKHYEDALEIYRETGHRQGEAAALGNIGLIYYDWGELDEALKHHKDALEIDQEIGDRQGEANDLGNIGNIYSDRGDLDEAFKHYEDALEIHREIGYRQGEAYALAGIGLIYYTRGNLDMALENMEIALEMHCSIGFREGEAMALSNIGLIYRAKGKPDEALKYHKDALEIHREIGYRQGEAADLGNIGLIYGDKGEPDKALKHHKDALKIDREIGYRQGEAANLGNIGIVYRVKGEFDEALKHNKDALEIDREIGYRQGEADDLGNIGLIYSDKDELDEALKYLHSALKILDDHNLVYGRDVIENAIKGIEEAR